MGGWKDVKAGGGLKFEVNEEVIGVFRGMRDGKYEGSPLVDIEVDGEVKTYYGKTHLASLLSSVADGTTVRIVFEGLKAHPQQRGKTYNHFTVQEASDDAEAQAPKKTAAPAPKPEPKAAKPAPKKAAQQDDDEVPF